MKTVKINLRRVCVILIASMLIVTFTVIPSSVYAKAPRLSKQTANFEIQFMENMIDHHAMAVMMAQMVIDKAVHPEFVQLLHDIITSQTQEIKMMQTWLKDWYGITYKPRMHMMDHGMMCEGMMSNGMMDPSKHEICFMIHMISHHESAIQDAQQALRRAYHPELKELAKDIIETQSKEIDMMQTWLYEWYGISDYRKYADNSMHESDHKDNHMQGHMGSNMNGAGHNSDNGNNGNNRRGMMC